MIEENARVVQLEGDYAWVETQRRSGCGSCSSVQSCGSASLNQLFNTKPLRVKAKNDLGAGVGDQVILGLNDEVLVRSSMIVYLLPLLVMLGGALLGHALGAGEGVVALAGMGGLAAGFTAVWFLGRRAAHNPLYQAVVLRHQDGWRAAPISFVKK